MTPSPSFQTRKHSRQATRAPSRPARGWMAILALWASAALAYDGPMVDGHAHWGADFNPPAILERYEKVGIQAQVVMPRYLGQPGDRPTTDEAVLEIARRYPGRFFVLAGMQRPDFTFMDWNAPNANSARILKEVDAKLAAREVYGIGEILVRHWAYAGDAGQVGAHAEIDKAFDAVFVRQIARIALRHDVPMVVHMEGYPQLAIELDKVLRDFPKLKLVWAHGCGRSSAAVIDRLLRTHTALYCDLSNMTNTGGYGSGWPRAEAFTHKMESEGLFFEDYRGLILAHPDRFFVGMDVAHQSRWRMTDGNTFERRVQRTRQLLAQLPPAVARKLALENVVSLFKLPIVLPENPSQR